MNLIRKSFHFTSTTTHISKVLAKKAKARTIIVKLLSTAGTGFFYTTRRPRTTPKLSFMKFDPRANQNVLFNEAKINRPN
ncbi:54S ribosomal protein L39, mitochondrial [Podila epicladia]|nr:54S ribosomal protein L39, mitochondrial [Podila epicladia]